jgi:ubiquinone/menaquinone biosynthesis C-methylase UbiE
MTYSNEKAEDVKKIEAESWKCFKDFDNIQSLKDVYESKWTKFLLKRSIKDLNLNSKTIINVGGGNGREAEFLIKNGAKNVLLLDIAPGQIECAKLRKKKHYLNNLEVELGDVEKLNHQNKKFDIGFIFMALHHFPSHQKSISEISRVSNQVIFIDIMNIGLTRVLTFFGFFKTEWCGIEPNRLKKAELKNFLEENGMKMEIELFFYPPYYSNNSIHLSFINFLSNFINYLIKKDVWPYFFGNVAIIKGYPNNLGVNR